MQFPFLHNQAGTVLVQGVPDRLHLGQNEPAFRRGQINRRHQHHQIIFIHQPFQRGNLMLQPIFKRHDLFLSLSLCDEATRTALWDVLKYGSDNNPRRIKRFFNIFNLLVQISGLNTPAGQNMIAGQKMLAKAIMLQLRFPAFYETLLENPAALNRLQSLARMKPADRTPYLADDPVLAEYYADRDLRRFITHTAAIACADDELLKYLQLTRAVHLPAGPKED